MNEKLAEYECRERQLTTQLFESFNIDNYNFTPPKSKKGYDGFYQLNLQDSSIVFEIKARDFEINKYDEYIIEVRKANSLAIWHNKGHKTKYFNFFNNGNGTWDFIAFDITSRIEEWRKLGRNNIIQIKYMNAYTYKDDGIKIPKEIIMIKFNPETDMKIEGGFFRL